MKKQIIDQSAHAIIGFGLVYALSMVTMMNPWQAFGLVMLMAGAREVMQHRPDLPGKGSALDMLFWAIGGLAGVVGL